MVTWCSIGLFGPTDDALWPQMAIRRRAGLVTHSMQTPAAGISPCLGFAFLERRRKAEFLYGRGEKQLAGNLYK
jgi:hypothetical protein